MKWYVNGYSTFLRGSFVSLLLFLYSCVGTVQDTTVDEKAAASPTIINLEYPGISDAYGISDTKLVATFPPYDQESADTLYQIFINNSSTPIELKADSLNLDFESNYTYTFKDLRANTTYNLRVEVYDSDLDRVSNSDNIIQAKTFINETADFQGLIKASLPQGEAGLTNVFLEWIPATSTGSPFSPKLRDPIGYEVSYIPTSSGVSRLLDPNYTGSDKVVRTLPDTFGASPLLSTQTSYMVPNLEPGVSYFFMVRAIHTGYFLYAEDNPNYVIEQNRQIKRVRTLSQLGSLDFDRSSLILENPTGIDGKTKVNAKWSPAEGAFTHYRLYYEQVANESVSDQLTDAIIDTKNLDATQYTVIDSSKFNHQITPLTAYSWYQVKIAACGNATCTSDRRVLSDLRTIRTIPSLSSFGGITELSGPKDSTAQELETIHVDFEPANIITGFLTNLEVYCHANATDSNPVRMQYGVPVAGSGKANCEGLELNTASPISFNGFANFETVSILGAVQGTNYCLSVIPVIDEAGYVDRDESSGVVVCKIHEINTPTIEQFPGINNSCSIAQRNLTLSWPEPTGGIFTHYLLAYKNADTGSFSFEEAKTAFEGGANAKNYQFVNLASGTNNHTLNSLTPGTRYQSGVLTYIMNGADYFYSDTNTSIASCFMELPEATFDEWIEIFAVGPKQDGRVPTTSLGEKTYLAESLNSDGIPLETEVDDSGVPTGDSVIYDGSNRFNGVYGTLGADPLSSNKHQYSNSGIIRIAWKDVHFYGGSVTFNDLIQEFEPTGGVSKTNRKFGYQVLRSVDGKVSWEELTSSSFDFQTPANNGLLHPVSVTQRKRVNAAGETFNAVIFTDYSVKSSSLHSDQERARIYHYKIVPYFNDQPLSYEDNPAHSVIKVILPPPNMALVHRQMANRQICHEMDREIDKSEDGHYTCDYNGLGSRAKSGPWIVGDGVYDIGGDLLVDRFELGCHITRGNLSTAAKSSFAGGLTSFQGNNDEGSLFEGCYMVQPQNFSSADPADPADTSYQRILKGDCLDFSFARISNRSTICANPEDPNGYRSHFVPGITGAPSNSYRYDCSEVDNLKANFPFEDFIAQSEFGAVFYNKAANSPLQSGVNEPLHAVTGNNDEPINRSSLFGGACNINLPYVDASGFWQPRWFGINELFNRLTYDGDQKDLSGMTMGDIRSSDWLYGGANHGVPAYNSQQFDDNTPILRAMTSNAAKLGTIGHMTQENAAQTCGEYSVEIGIEKDGTFHNISGKEYQKRLPRRKEHVVMSAWPANYDESTVTQIEDGVFVNGDGDNVACAAPDKGNPGGHEYQTDSPLHSYIYKRQGGYAGPFFSGSSSRDPGNANTENCTSKFGIQDIVGNLSEYSAENFFCDMSGEEIWLGSPGNQGASIPWAASGLGLSSGELYDSLVMSSWVLSDPDTGRCSSVETGSARFGLYSSGGIVNSIFLNGGYNNGILQSLRSFDQESVLDIRNSDGTFLDFGQSNLASPLSNNNTISIRPRTPDHRRSHYFNPAVGLPLECGSNACAQSRDNLSFTTNFQVTEFTLDPTNFDIANFPVTNSGFTSIGMSEIRHWRPQIWAGNSVTYVSAIDPSGPSYTQTTEILAANTARFSSPSWLLGRSSLVATLNGGSFTNTFTGRYTTSLEDDNPGRRAYRGSSGSNGIRCMIRIED